MEKNPCYATGFVQLKLQQKKRPVSDKAVDNVASVDVDDEYRVELGSVVLRQLRANLYHTIRPDVALTQAVM